MYFPEGLENTPLNWKKRLGFRNLQEKLEKLSSSFTHAFSKILVSVPIIMLESSQRPTFTSVLSIFEF